MREHLAAWREFLRAALRRGSMLLRRLRMSNDQAIVEGQAEKPKEDKFQWADEGVSTIVRVVILGWAGAILTLNYVTIPGVPQKNIDPTFIASVFTGCLASFNIQTTKKKEEKDEKKISSQTESTK